MPELTNLLGVWIAVSLLGIWSCIGVIYKNSKLSTRHIERAVALLEQVERLLREGKAQGKG